MTQARGGSDSDHAHTRPVARLAAASLVLLTASSLSLVAVLLGETATVTHAVTPVTTAKLWLAEAGLVAVAATVVATILVFFCVETINRLATPRVGGYDRYTLAGIGGLVGVALASAVSLTGLSQRLASLGVVVPGHVGDSPLALAAVAIPLGTVLYHFTGTGFPDEATRTRTDFDGRAESGPKQQSDRASGDASPPRRATHEGQEHVAAEQSTSNRRSETARQQPPARPDADEPSTSARTRLDDSSTEFRWETAADVSFDDVGGMADVKRELRTEVITPLESPERAAALGVSAPNILFHGPPGTGKTYMAQALATELGLPFAKLSGADLQSKWINESATKVNQLFREAEQVAATAGGAVVFLDELDSVLKARGGSANAHAEDTKVVNEFLNHLEATDDHNIVFIGATNRVDALDDAGIRAGRIDKKIHIGTPDASTRAAILRTQLNGRQHTLTDEQIEHLAAETDGAVAADLEAFVERAAKNALARGSQAIQPVDIRSALETDNSPSPE